MNTEGKSRLALYPGSFDPITLGHLDIVKRASALFDHVEVTVAKNPDKSSMLPVEERCLLIEACLLGYGNVSVGSFDGLLVEYARSRSASVLVRGLRQVSDFDFEFRMAFANRRLAPEIETVFLMTSEDHALISASIVREIQSMGGDVASFVPPPVVEALQKKRANSQPPGIKR